MKNKILKTIYGAILMGCIATSQSFGQSTNVENDFMIFKQPAQFQGDTSIIATNGMSMFGSNTLWMGDYNLSKTKALTWDNIAANGLTLGYSNILSSTTLGSEGMRFIGTLGGYKLDEFFEDTALRGPSRDSPIFTHIMAPIPGLVISWSEGDVYDPSLGYYHLVADTNTLTDNTVNYAYWTHSSPNVVSWNTGTRPNVSNTIMLAEISTAFGMVIHSGSVDAVGNLPLMIDAGLCAVFPSLIVNGIQYSAIGSNLNDIIEIGGTEYHDLSQENIHSAKNLTNYGFVPPQTFLLAYHHTNSAYWGYSITNQLPVDQWDNGTNLVACVVSNWYRGLFVSMADSLSMHYIYPTAEYTNYNDAFAAVDPTLPSGFNPYVPISTAYIFQGGDTTLRTDGIYWLDRRFMIRRGAIVSGGGSSSGTIPTLYQVLLQGADGGGIFPTVSGIPSTPPQLVNKQYVDQSVNNINFGKVYVDRNGNDMTGAIRDSIHSFRTVQAAIDAAVLVANDTNRFVVCVSPGIYNENITMKNYIGIQALDIEATVINGSVTYPPAFNDITGSEIQMLTISASNTPALVLSSGADTAYMGIRSCYVKSMYDNDATNKTVVSMARGQVEVYGTSYLELNVAPTNGSESVCHSQIFEYTDPSSTGLIIFNSYGSSMIITSSDENDDISSVYTHDTMFKGIDSIQSGLFRIIVDGTGLSFSNNIKIVSNERSSTRVGFNGVLTSVLLPLTNTCNVFCGYSKDGKAIGSAVAFKDNQTTFTVGTPTAIWWGAATTTNDTVLAMNNIIMPLVNGTNYPQVYTNDGSAGNVRYVTAMADGNLVVSGKAYAYGGFVGDGSGLTNLPLQPDTFALWRVGTGLVAGAASYSDNPANAVVMGFSATGTMKSVVLGYQAKGLANSVAIGDKAVATDGGVAVGGEARGDRFGFALGPYANATNFGVAIGNAAIGRFEGVALGNSAHGAYYGVGIGVNASGDNYGTAIGHEADGQNTNVAIGYNAKIQFPIRNTIAIGAGTVASNSLYGGYTHFWGVPVISKAGQINATNIIGTPAIYWISTGSPNMNLANNWLGGVVPTQSDIAVFDNIRFPSSTNPNGGTNNAHLSILRGSIAIYGGTFRGDIIAYDASSVGGCTVEGRVVLRNSTFVTGATIKDTATFFDNAYDGGAVVYNSLRLLNGKWLWPNSGILFDLSNSVVSGVSGVFSNLTTTVIQPFANGTNNLVIRQATGGTNLMVFDTTTGYVGVNGRSSSSLFEIRNVNAGPDAFRAYVSTFNAFVINTGPGSAGPSVHARNNSGTYLPMYLSGNPLYIGADARGLGVGVRTTAITAGYGFDVNDTALIRSNLTVYGTINATNMPTGSGRMFMAENGPTSILYHVTSGGHTNKVGEFWTP